MEPTDKDRSGISKVAAQRRPCEAKFYLVCLCCGSKLEVTNAAAGQTFRCPTCGVSFQVPDIKRLRSSKGGVIPVGDAPEERQVVHAYAAAGSMAPEVVVDSSGESMIRCRRCGIINPIEAESCCSCGIPFTIEAGSAFREGRWNGMTVATMTLGVFSLITFPVPILGIAAIVTGLVAVKRLYIQYNGLQWLAAWSGVVLGMLSLIAFAVRYVTSW